MSEETKDKKAWKSKTLWLSAIAAILPLAWPPASEWIKTNPETYSSPFYPAASQPGVSGTQTLSPVQYKKPGNSGREKRQRQRPAQFQARPTE